MPTNTKETQQDMDDYVARRFLSWIKRQPKNKVFYVECDRDYHERNEMQYQREVYGLSGTAYFSPIEVFPL